MFGHNPSYEWHEMGPGLRYSYAAGLGLASGVGFWMGMQDSSAWLGFILGTAFGLAAIAMLVEHRTEIVKANGVILRQGLLFGRIPVWNKTRPFTDIAGIGFKRSGSEADTVFVGFVPRRGRLIAVRYFSAVRGLPCRVAEEFAQQLARDAGLDVSGDSLC